MVEKAVVNMHPTIRHALIIYSNPNILSLLFMQLVRATCTGFGPENIVIVAGINEVKSSFYALLSHYFSTY